MQGSVHKLTLADQDSGQPHLYVVILAFSGNRDCIVVPAYSAEGFKINEYLNASRKAGMPDDKLFVKLDNAAHIDFTCYFPPKEAVWCTARHRRISQHLRLPSNRIGQMKASGIIPIVEALLALADSDDNGDLSKNAIRQLHNFQRVLKSEPS
jgi:hypothetical protein